ncbi:hypothetical protein ECDEC8A_4322 [Escherichia coli DEC8A]|nr:hypothetical protein ECDEC8A_4322 [Escherichia coli DEC8A]
MFIYHVNINIFLKNSRWKRFCVQLIEVEVHFNLLQKIIFSKNNFLF